MITDDEIKGGLSAFAINGNRQTNNYDNENEDDDEGLFNTP